MRTLMIDMKIYCARYGAQYGFGLVKQGDALP
jgi:hypothetical protein